VRIPDDYSLTFPLNSTLFSIDGPEYHVHPFDIETLATDFVPHGVAADTLRGLICHQEEELKGLDNEIRQLKARLPVLEAQRVEVAKTRDAFLVAQNLLRLSQHKCLQGPHHDLLKGSPF